MHLMAVKVKEDFTFDNAIQKLNRIILKDAHYRLAADAFQYSFIYNIFLLCWVLSICYDASFFLQITFQLILFAENPVKRSHSEGSAFLAGDSFTILFIRKLFLKKYV